MSALLYFNLIDNNNTDQLKLHQIENVYWYLHYRFVYVSTHHAPEWRRWE